MKTFASKLERRLVAFLSHRPRLYALVVGTGVVLFWRGIWHTADQIYNLYQVNTSIDLVTSPWWDGPLSLAVGLIILYFTGAFVSSFIGNELILSGLRGEKKLNEKTEVEVKTEVRAIADIKDAIISIEDKINDLEKKVKDHHH